MTEISLGGYTTVMNFLFDFDHTLAVDNHLEENVVAALAKKYCRSIPDREKVLQAIMRFRSGEVTVEKAILDAFAKWNCPADLNFFDEFQTNALALVSKNVKPLPGAVGTIKKLRKLNVPIAIFSNGWTKLQHAKAKAIGFPGPVIASEEIGAWKPERRAFELALSRLNFKAEETAYVGDSPETDVVGAKKAGLKTIWANFENAVYPSELEQPDWTITSLFQIIEIIKRHKIV